MTDDRTDTKIRALMIELVDATPSPPTWESIQARLTETAPSAAALDAESTTAEGATVTSIETDEDLPTIGDLPEYARHEERRTPRWRPIAAATGAVGVLIGGSFAYAAFNGTDGAASPEAAVEAFVDAVAEEDLVGALESLPPSEREVLTDTARDLSAEAERIGLTDGLDTGDVSGLDVEIDGLTTEVEQLGDGFAAVHLDGTLTTSSTGAELPLGDVVFDALDDVQGFEDGVADLARAFDEEDVFVVAVEEDGGWHASAWYTVAEYLRRAADEPLPGFGTRPVAPEGAESAEAATRAFIEATAVGDYHGALGLLDPVEGRVLYDYGPLWLSQVVQEEFDGYEVSLDRLDLTTREEDGRTVVSLEGYAITSTDDYGTSSVDVGDDCVTQTAEYDDPSFGDGGDDGPYCREDAIADGTPAWAWDTAYTADFVTVERDGRWYLSPARSIATTILTGARAIPGEGLTPELVEQGAVVSIALRAYNLLAGQFGGMGWTYGPLYSSESCYSTVDSEGALTEECYDGSSEFSEVGTPIDPETGLEMTATTFEVPRGSEGTVVEGMGTPIDPGSSSPTTIDESPSTAPTTASPSEPTTTETGADGEPNG